MPFNLCSAMLLPLLMLVSHLGQRCSAVTPPPTLPATSEHSWTYSDFIPETYDRTLPPDKDVINISITVRVTQLLVVNEAEQSYTVDMHYTQKWPDPRLKYPSSNATLPLGGDWKNRLWLPSVFLTNSLNPSMMQMMPLFLEIEANTSRLVSTTRQVVKLRCNMDLAAFPMDTQTCPMEFTLRELADLNLRR